MIGSLKLFCSNRSWPSLLSFQSSVLAAHPSQLSHGHPAENFSSKRKKRTTSTSTGKPEGFMKKCYLDKIDHMGIFSPFLPFLGYIHRYKCSHFHNYSDIPIIDQQVFLYTITKIMTRGGRTILNRYRQKRPKVDASIVDSALSPTRRSDASKKSVPTFGRFRLWTSFESSPVSVNSPWRLRENWGLYKRSHRSNYHNQSNHYDIYYGMDILDARN